MSTATKTAAALELPTVLLDDALSTVARVAGAAGSFGVPGVRFTVSGGVLALEAVGPSVAIRSTVPTPGQGDVSFNLPAKVALGVVKSLSGGTVLFTVGDDGRVGVASGAASYSLRAMFADGVPPMPPLPPAGGARLSVTDFAAALAKVAGVAARDHSRLILTGVLLEVTAERLVMSATDAYRLATKAHVFEEASPAEFAAVVPTLALGEVAKLGDGDLDVQVVDGRFVASSESATVVARLVDGNFPNYRQLLNEPTPHTVAVSTSELAAVLKRMGVAAGVRSAGKAQDASREGVVTFTFDDGSLTVEAESEDVGTVRESIPVAWHDERLQIGFDFALLRSVAALVDAEVTNLRMIKAERPVFFGGDGDDSATFMVMPRRITV